MREIEARGHDVAEAPMRPGYVAGMGEQDPDGDFVLVALELRLHLPPIDALEGFQFLQGTICDFR